MTLWGPLVAVLLAPPPLLPDPTLTPGDIASTNPRIVCVPGYADAHRNVSADRKLAVYAAYGLAPAGRFQFTVDRVRYWQSDYEVDHLVSLQLGGSNERANLWPQSYRTKTYNATAKDALENRLHWLVCIGKTLTLAEAQLTIREHWIRAYEAFITHGPPKPRAAP